MVSEGDVDMGIVPGPEKSTAYEFQALRPLIVMQRQSSTRTILETEFRKRGIPY